MKLATQSEIDAFMEWAINDPESYPFLSHSRWIKPRKVPESDWYGLTITDERVSYLLHIDFNRNISLSATICLYSKTNIAAGRAILVLKEVIQRYKPFAIDSTVAKSNIKSLKITKKILGDPWGLEPNAVWNMLTGETEDCYYFRKLL